MEFAHQLGKEIKRLREEKGLTQNELAVKLDKDTDYISKIERGLRVPSIKTLLRLTTYFKVKPSELFNNIGY